MDHTIHTGVGLDGTGYLLTTWADGTLELATRPHPGATWSPPVVLMRQSSEVS